MKIEIGDVIIRDRQPARSHRVESQIADRYVTRCGKQMLATDADGNALLLTGGEPTCKYCAR